MWSQKKIENYKIYMIVSKLKIVIFSIEIENQVWKQGDRAMMAHSCKVFVNSDGNSRMNT